jgi:hypothetical protein
VNRHQPPRLVTRSGCSSLGLQIGILGQVAVTDS